jgi:hypothetical protein
VGGRKKREFALFSFALGAFGFFAFCFLRAFAIFFGLRARERENAKNATAPTSRYTEPISPKWVKEDETILLLVTVNITWRRK